MLKINIKANELEKAKNYGGRITHIAIVISIVTGTVLMLLLPLGFIAAFAFHSPVWLVYIIISLDEIVKLPAVYIHYKKYVWVRNITR